MWVLFLEAAQPNSVVQTSCTRTKSIYQVQRNKAGRFSRKRLGTSETDSEGTPITSSQGGEYFCPLLAEELHHTRLVSMGAQLLAISGTFPEVAALCIVVWLRHREGGKTYIFEQEVWSTCLLDAAWICVCGGPCMFYVYSACEVQVVFFKSLIYNIFKNRPHQMNVLGFFSSSARSWF